MRRTKILCTLGPASNDPKIFKAMVESGLNAVRINFSHGTYAEHQKTVKMVRAVSEDLKIYIPLIADLQGPKIRVGLLKEGGMRLEPGNKVTLLSGCEKAEESFIPVTYEYLHKDVNPGDKILLDDGRIRLSVLNVKKKTVVAIVEIGGLLTSHKGINLPGVPVTAPSLTEKDLLDIDFILDLGFDYIALSFVRSGNDLHQLREILHRSRSKVPTIAKIEKPQALSNLDEIIEATDAIMVARGDLGVEIGPENVPGIQKEVIEKTNRQGLVSITATQMLESMINSPTPTRAEASDVANAVFDGSDVVMLSGETSIGKYPVEAVRMMAKIVESAENSSRFVRPISGERNSLFPSSDAVAHAAVLAAKDLKARAIVSFSQSGSTCKLIAKYRPECMIYGASSDQKILRQMGLFWGVQPIKLYTTSGTDSMVKHIETELLAKNLIEPDDMIVITAGTPIASPGTTNTLKIHRIMSEAEERSLTIHQQGGISISIDKYLCIRCGICVEICPMDIYRMTTNELVVDENVLKNCLMDKLCASICPTQALTLDILNKST